MYPEKGYLIKDLPYDDRPREKLMEYGSEVLTNSELLALILSNGTKNKSAVDLGKELIQESDGLEKLSDFSIERLSQINGIGIAKATKIIAVFEIARRLRTIKIDHSSKISTPKEAACLVMDEMKNYKKEYFNIILLNTKNNVIKISNISIGSLNSSIVHPREVFAEAIKHSAASIILVHNHPSGDPKPSKEDVGITNRLVKTGEVIGISVIDHIIIGYDKYLSLKEEGII